MSARLRSATLIALLLAIGAWAGFGLRVGSDLARFMPAPHNPDERVLVGEIGSGPGSRILMLAISAPDEAAAVRLSKGLRVALQDDDAFARVFNGEVDLAAELAQLLPLRFTHSPAMDAAAFDSEALADVLGERLADMGGIGGEAFDTLLAHDPQFLTLAMAESWQPSQQPELRDGVWFGAQGDALLVVETNAGGFDPQAQAEALASLRETFAGLEDASSSRLTVSGPGSFSARMSDRVRTEATWLGGIASVALIVLLFIAYRSPLFVLASALPLLCAGAAGIVALRLGFGEAHGITLAFAFTLIGVAQDYPVHLLSHTRPGAAPQEVAHELWPALRLGVASTTIAYLTLFSAEAEGLAQLAVFTIAGLLAAGLVTRYLLPDLLPAARRDVLSGRRFVPFADRLLRFRGGWWPVLPVLVLFGVALMVGNARPWWNNDLASLTPLPKAWLEDDARLRADLATPDARHLLVLSGPSVEAVLLTSEALMPAFTALVARGAIADHGLPSRYRPSDRVQSWRLSKLPAPDILRATLADAAEATGFDAEFFEPMVEDVQVATAPGGEAAIAHAFAASPAGGRVAATLRQHDEGTYALVELTGIADIQAVRAAIDSTPQARLLDVKSAAEGMVVAFRERVLGGLAIAALALLSLVMLSSGPRRAMLILPPVILGLAVTVAVLRLSGIELTLFHLIALMLAAGLGMDYALFFGHADAGDDQRRTLHAVLISAISTALVFGLLATSSIPVLRAIGVTVGIGVVAQFVLSLLMARADEAGTQASGHA